MDRSEQIGSNPSKRLRLGKKQVNPKPLDYVYFFLPQHKRPVFMSGVIVECQPELQAYDILWANALEVPDEYFESPTGEVPPEAIDYVGHCYVRVDASDVFLDYSLLIKEAKRRNMDQCAPNLYEHNLQTLSCCIPDLSPAMYLRRMAPYFKPIYLGIALYFLSE